ncbi:MAG: hypothetical protein KTR28_00295 [Micavibrio sp.]|nr:hypothetical protein [Micavibrio sp.]
MKPTIKTLVLGASVVAIGLGTSAINKQAHAANKGTSEYVKDVDIDFAGSTTPVINIINTSADKDIEKIKPTVQSNSLNLTIDGFVECKKQNKVDFLGAWAYFGGVGIGGFGQLATQGTLHDEKIDVAYTTKEDQLAEATEDTFSIPLNKIKNGHPALRIDPLEELEKARQSYNGSDLDFYKNDREIIVQRPISLGAICGKLANTDKRSVGFETKNASIKIKYKGDKNLLEKPKLNAQLNGNVPNQVQQNPNLPFQLNDVDFQPNIPNYVGKCIPDQNPKIRMNFNVAGGKKGQIDLRVKGVSNTYAMDGVYFQTSGIVKNPQNGGGFLEFNFPLKEMLSQDNYAFMAVSNNKTWNHNMKIEARYKNFDGSNQWSQWTEFDGKVFKHRCTPQLNPQLKGAVNGGVKAYDNGGDKTPKLDVQIKPSKPARAKTSN